VLSGGTPGAVKGETGFAGRSRLSSNHVQSFIEAWYKRGATLRQVFIQPDARLFTRPVGCAHFSQRTDEHFHVAIRPPEPIDGIRERPACGRIFVQKFLSFLACHLRTSQSDRSIGTPVGKHRRHDKREHDQRKDQHEIPSPRDVFNVSLGLVRALLFFPDLLLDRRALNLDP